MVSITVSVPEKTKKLMKQFEEMNWSGFVKKSIEKKTEQLEKIEVIMKQLEKEKDVTDWAVKLQRVSRTGRLEVLKKKGSSGLFRLESAVLGYFTEQGYSIVSHRTGSKSAGCRLRAGRDQPGPKRLCS